MSKALSKLATIILLVIVSTFFISGTNIDRKLSVDTSVVDDYTMEITGNLNTNLNGVIDFETGIQTTSKGISFSMLKLKLTNDKNVLPHSIEFLISQENGANILPTGVYKVSRNQESILNYFEGVFGFANINALGELPLFTQSGEIQIKYLDDSMVEGTLRVLMSNTVGKSIRIAGNFTVKK
ncbi:MAG: hypothetical protein AB8B59_18600 [Maribacter sp.]